MRIMMPENSLMIGPLDRTVYKENPDVDLSDFRSYVRTLKWDNYDQWIDYVISDLCEAAEKLYGDHFLLRAYCDAVKDLFRSYTELEWRYRLDHKDQMNKTLTDNIDSHITKVNDEIRGFHNSNMRMSHVIGPSYTYFVVTTLVARRNDEYVKDMLSNVDKLCSLIVKDCGMLQ